MQRHFLLKNLVFASAALVLLFPLVSNIAAQRRDYMTDAEVEVVRDAQDIDLRIDVLTKMIDRRFAALGMESGGWKESAKESDKWGEKPKGTRLQLFSDIRYLMQKAVDDVDDVAEHNENTLTQNRTTGKLLSEGRQRTFISVAEVLEHS